MFEGLQYNCEHEDCNSYYRTPIPALGHAFGLRILRVATDSKEGTFCYACTREDCEAVQNKQTIFPYKKIVLDKSQYSYTGEAIKPVITVKDSRGATIPASYYTVVYIKNKNVGTGTVHVTFSGKYKGTLKKDFKIVQGKQSISVAQTSYTLKKSDLKKSATTINLGAKAKTSLSYSVSAKYLSVSGGKVKVANGTPKGTYTVTIKAKETKNVKGATKKITIKVK